uniref:Uncharacterized protein n=1 Tax=Rhizophora mucronata TaxID=61149 RepID=A0A2P2QBQ5_RHIMU
MHSTYSSMSPFDILNIFVGLFIER